MSIYKLLKDFKIKKFKIRKVLPLKLGALIGLFLVALLVLPSVSAVDNEHIALYWSATNTPNIYETVGGSARGGTLVDTFNFITLSNDTYIWSYTIPEIGGEHYKSKPSNNKFYWNVRRVNSSILFPNSALWGAYLMVEVRNNQIDQKYDVLWDGELVVSHDFSVNGTSTLPQNEMGFLLPLYNLSTPLDMSGGYHNLTIIQKVDDIFLQWNKYGYADILLVKRGNTSIPNITVIVQNSTYYHKDFEVSIVGNLSSTLEIYNAWISINGEYNQSLSTSGLFGFNASGTKDMMNNLIGENNITVCMNDSYSNIACKDFNITIFDAPDIITEAINFNSSNITSGNDMNITIQHFNNGTIDANNFLCNTTFNPGDIGINNHSMNLSVGQGVNMSHNYHIVHMSGWFTITHTMSNTTVERTSNNNLITPIFKIHSARFGVDRTLRDMTLNISVLDEDGIEIFNNQTSDLTNDYFEFNPALASNSANITVNFTTNNTYLSENGLTTADLIGTRWNGTTSIFDNMTTDLDYILSTGYDDNSFWFVTTKYSIFNIGIKSPSEPEPTPTPLSSSSSSGGGGGVVSKRNIILICNTIDCGMSKDVLDVLSNEFKIFKFDAYTFIEMNKTIPYTTAIIILGREKALDGIGEISKLYYPSQGDYHKFYFKFFPYKRRVFVFGGKDRYETASFFKEGYSKIISFN